MTNKMKNKNFIYKGLAVAFLTGLSFTNIGCSGSYLDEVQNSGAFSTDSYFKMNSSLLVH